MKTRFLLFLAIVPLAFTSTVFSQSVSINTTGNVSDTSAMLDITSLSKGLLIPRMSSAQKLAIFSPADGLLVYQTDGAKGFYFYNIAIPAWVFVAQGSGGIASLNGLTGASQTFSTPGTVGTAPAWNSSGAAHTLNIPLASASGVTAGLISNADYTTLFNNQISNLSVTPPLTYNGGVIGITQSSTSDDGYLSVGDYNLFNNKVSSIALNGGTVYTTTSFGISGGAATGTLVLNSQIKNKFFAGPGTGANAQPTFRAIAAADLPVATTTAVTGLGAVSVGNGLSITPGGVLSVTNVSSGGTVTSASVVSANGLAGTVANPATTPAITLSTTVSGMVKGNGTALSAATSGTDYAPGTAANATGIVKSTTGTGALTTATAADFPVLNQNTTGTASNITGVLNAASHPALTGDVTNTAGSVVTTISNNVVSNAKLATMPANTFKANNTAAAANASDITGTQATAMLDVFTPAAKGLVPASSGGTANFLRADGTFAVPSGTTTGTVTSVSVASANGVSGSVATATTTPAITVTLGAITPSSVAATGTVTGSNLSGSHSGISSGTNTGDETNATIKTKLGAASATTDGYLTLADWNTFNNKASTTNTISSLNGLTATAQTFATGTTGTDFNIASGGSVHTFNIPDASATARGVLTTADWTTFNNKATTTGSWSTTGNAGTAGGTNFIGTTDASDFVTKTNNAERMRILNSNGYIGIGTSVPSSLLELQTLAGGGVSDNLSITSYNNAGVPPDPAVRFKSATGTPAAPGFITANTELGALIGNTWNGTSLADVAKINFIAEQNLSASAMGTRISFYTASGASSVTEKMRLDQNGNLGIGSATPSQRLDVSGNIRFSGALMPNNAPGIAGQVLTSGGAGTYPTWANPGTVTSLSVSTANGLAGSVSASATAPVITLATTVNGIVKGNGTALSAATSGTDYAPGTSANATGIVKSTTSTGALTTAVAADFPILNQSTTGNAATVTTNANLTGPVTSIGNATAITNNAVTYDKIQNVSATSKLLGSSSATTAVQELTIGSGLSLSGTTLNAAGSGGTVTSVSVATANGVSGTVATSATTPAITITLGDITPLSVAASGTVTGSNLSGTNTGDETNATIKTKLGPATTTNDGYLTATDWSTFNGKANTTNVISSLNALTATSQTFATGVSGTDFNIVSGGSAHTFNIPDASATARGLLTTGAQTIAGSKTFSSPPVFSSMTPGSVLYIGSSGAVSQNNGSLFWDNTTGRLGLGTNSPSQRLDVSGTINASNSIISRVDVAVDRANANAGTLSPGLVFGQGGSGEGIASKRTSGGNVAGLDFYTNNINRIAITQGGNVGIGVVLPANKLQVSATADPLSLLGVQTGASTDSVLTITNGVVRKLLPSALTTSSGNTWTTTGNSGTTAANNFIGTTDAKGFRVKVNTTAIQGLLVDSLGNVAVGNAPVFTAGNAREKFLVDAGSSSANPTPTGAYNVISGKGYLDSYIQSNIQNLSPGTNASSDIVASNDGATEGTNFIDMGINSSGNTSTGVLGGAATGYLYSTGNDFAIGNGTSAKSLNFFTTDATGSAERMRINSAGNVGIGTNAPATALHVSATTNPLTLNGVAVGTNTTTDSLLTITNGLVRKLPVTTFVSAANTWSTNGNAGTTAGTNFMGTTDNRDLVFKTANTQAMTVTSNQSVGIGPSPVFQTAVNNRELLLVDAGTTSSTNVISAKGTIDSYLQLNIQNKSATASASSDIVATADNGSETTNFVDMGINSSAYTGGYYGNANDSYLYNLGQNFLIGTGTADKDLIFLTGGSAQSSATSMNNERMRINGTTGYVGIGTNIPQALSHTVLSTASGPTPADVATIETINTTTTATSQLPYLNLVRQYPAASYTGTTTAVGPVINFGFKSAGFTGARGDFAQLATSTFTGNSRIDFLTRTGMTNGNPAGGTLAEAMSLVGSNLGVGVFAPNLGPVSTLEVNGSVGHAINTSAAAVTLTAANYTMICTGATAFKVTLPTAASSTRRIYVIVNQTIARTIDAYLDLSGTSTGTLPVNSSITIQSNGTSWYRIQ